MTIAPEILQNVRRQLAELEQTRNIRVLFACESGSRAWGFASPDSDYDVRFLYVHPRDWYLSIELRRDVIELPLNNELDISGWDLRKALRLLRKSNPPLLEWLKSPLVYQCDQGFFEDFKALAAEFYSQRHCFSHYLHMAFGNWNKYLRDREEVSLKKYLYVFRPVLACRWIEKRTEAVPMLFSDLTERMFEPREAEVKSALTELVRKKQGSEELAVAPAVKTLSDFIAAELPRLEALTERSEALGDVEAMDRLFRRYAM